MKALCSVILIVLLASHALVARAQFTVEGTVFVSDAKQALSDVRVATCDSSSRAWTDGNGYYKLHLKDRPSCLEVNVVDGVLLYSLKTSFDAWTDFIEVDFRVPPKPAEYAQLHRNEGDINPKTLSTITGEMKGGSAHAFGGRKLETSQSLRVLKKAILWGSVTTDASGDREVTISIPTDDTRARVDSTGRFEFRGIPPGLSSITAVKGPDSVSIEILLVPGLNRLNIAIK
ncbi:MAG: hypothetical protein HKN43_00420 [Rhodothermales bacterium]|nr:hypothetical protein [Rhodothermales bacterium]